MAAYAVMARIGRVDPHLTLRDIERDDVEGSPPGLAVSASEDLAVLDVTDEPGPVRERLTRLNELWRQTTFYLFDADSWRA
jgi:hypothetical protein